jgi:hypothetical protein
MIRYVITVPQDVPADAMRLISARIHEMANSPRWEDVSVSEGMTITARIHRLNVVRTPSIRAKNAQKRLR